MIVAKGEVLPAAADDALRPLLTGPVRPAKLLAVVTDAVHLQVGSTLVVVCGPSAVRLPGSVTLAAPLSTILDLDVLDPATVGAGHLVLGRRALSVRRWMAAPRPRLRNVAAAVRRARTVDVPAAPALLEQALRGETDVNTTIAGMIGLGPGLTPAGDDIVAGALLTLTAANDPRQRAVGAATHDQLHRTTAVSRALLQAAAQGRCIPQAARFIAALDGREELNSARNALIDVGHSSGEAVVTGIVAALTTRGPKEAAA